MLRYTKDEVRLSVRVVHTGFSAFLMELTDAFISVPIEAGGAPLGAHSILQHISVHAKQAIGAQRAFTGVTAPVAL